MWIIVAVLVIVALLAVVLLVGLERRCRKARGGSGMDVENVTPASPGFVSATRALRRASSVTTFHENIGLSTFNTNVQFAGSVGETNLSSARTIPNDTYGEIGPGCGRLLDNATYMPFQGRLRGAAHRNETYGAALTDDATYAVIDEDGIASAEEALYGIPIMLEHSATNGDVGGHHTYADISDAARSAQSSLDVESEYAMIGGLLTEVALRSSSVGSGGTRASQVWSAAGPSAPLFIVDPDDANLSVAVHYNVTDGGWVDEASGDLYMDVEAHDDDVLQQASEPSLGDGQRNRKFSLAAVPRGSSDESTYLRIVAHPGATWAGQTPSQFVRVPADSRHRLGECNRAFERPTFCSDTSTGGVVRQTSIRRSNPLFRQSHRRSAGRAGALIGHTELPAWGGRAAPDTPDGDSASDGESHRYLDVQPDDSYE